MLVQSLIGIVFTAVVIYLIVRAIKSARKRRALTEMEDRLEDTEIATQVMTVEETVAAKESEIRRRREKLAAQNTDGHKPAGS
ncbi:MAG: hypothetical protein Q8R25_04585 [bacterium]|nr:hypothetical protein [bacterium]